MTARVAALAAGLAAAAADRSRAQWPEAAGARAQALALERRVSELAQRNAAAYSMARQALAERGSGGDQQARDRRLGVVIEQAAEPPLELARDAADIAELAGLIATRGAGEVRPDAAIAAALAAVASRAAARLVQINLVVGGDHDRAAQARRYAHAAAEAAAAADAA